MQVWGRFEEQPREDYRNNAGVSRLTASSVTPKFSPNKVVLGRTLEHAKTAAIRAGLDKPT